MSSGISEIHELGGAHSNIIESAFDWRVINYMVSIMIKTLKETLILKTTFINLIINIVPVTANKRIVMSFTQLNEHLLTRLDSRVEKSIVMSVGCSCSCT
jgi:hypothetical protein